MIDWVKVFDGEDISDEAVAQALSPEEMEENPFIAHYGMKFRSGRYPYGSGEDPYQHDGDDSALDAYADEYGNGAEDIIARVERLKKDGWQPTAENIKAEFGMSTGQYRAEWSNATNARKAVLRSQMKELADQGLGYTEIGRRLGGISGNAVKYALEADKKGRTNVARATADFLRSQVDEKGVIQIGEGVEYQLSDAAGMKISKERLKAAVELLKEEGYEEIGGRVQQQTNPNQKTTVKVLAKPGTPKDVIYQHPELVKMVGDDMITSDGGDSFHPKFRYPSSMDSSRLDVVYAEDGGTSKDGLIEIRRGVPDLDLGDSNYAQVRILVDDKLYLKGMAVYADDLPAGKDIRFNSNKKRGTPLAPPDKEHEGVLKPIKSDPDDPFGSLLRESGGQSDYTDPVTGEKKLSLINKTRIEGDWDDWSDTIPAQFLSKQPRSLIKQQIDLSVADKESELRDIQAIDNDVVRQKMLMDFAEKCDTQARDLDTVSFPRQKYKVILPSDSVKDGEVYAPTYEDGEEIALVRFPHAGRFEIPILKVNNKIPEARMMVGTNPDDSIVLNSKMAAQLSGADFDGDTVIAIPTRTAAIQNRDPLPGLKDFDPKLEYAKPEGVAIKTLTKQSTQPEMGKISNLITDMTIMGAPDEEIERAVKHSMVVIDAAKHSLDYTRSFSDNDIKTLKVKYQGVPGKNGKVNTPAATLISKAGSDLRIPEIKPGRSEKEKYVTVDPETGEKLFYETGRTRKELTGSYASAYKKAKKNKDLSPEERKAEAKRIYNEAIATGNYKDVPILTTTHPMDVTPDARSLISSRQTMTEYLYADYANALKKIANSARKEAVNITPGGRDPDAAKRYSGEVESLKSKLDAAKANAPKERAAQLAAEAEVREKIEKYDITEKKDVKKLRNKTLTQMRQRYGAKRDPVDITDKEWEAIQAKAVSPTVLKEIMTYGDQDKIRKLATPRSYTELSESKQNKIKAMAESGNYTTYQIAAALDISTSTVSKYINGKE